MNTRKNLVGRILMSLVVLLLGLTSTGAAATAVNHTFAGTFLLAAGAGDADPWWQSHTVVGSDGRVHVTFTTSEYIYYSVCASNCTEPESWTVAPIAPSGNYDSLAYPSLTLDAGNRPRIVRYDNDQYFYMQCNSNCTKPAGWTTIKIPFSEDNWNIQSNHNRYSAMDGQGRLHVVAPGYAGLLYATCSGSCTSAAGWQTAHLDLDDSVEYPQLVVTADGRPRVTGTNGDGYLDYLQCDAACMQPGNWHRVNINSTYAPSVIYSSHALQLDGQGRPRIAYYGYQGDELTYAWCNGNATNAANWSSYALAAPPWDDRTVDLAFDSQDRPRLAYGSGNADLVYLECTSNCHPTSGDPQWSTFDAETGDMLDFRAPVPLEDACWASTWWIEGYPSLAVDGDDRPIISYHAKHVQLCGDSITPFLDARAIGVASAGAGGPVLGHKVFVPLAVRMR